MANRDGSGLGAFFIGLGVGIAAGMLVAPRPGSETRRDIRDKALEGGDYVRRRGTELREVASNMADKASERVGRSGDRARDYGSASESQGYPSTASDPYI